jgi:AraC-like DNA-binding protein
VHEHLSDTELARYAIDQESLKPEQRQVIEQESARCATCGTSHDFFSVITAEHLPEVEPTDVSSNSDAARAYIERIETEDREANEVLAQEKLLASPIKTAWINPHRDKRLLTGGVVRRLCAHANSVHESEPLDALTFADAAISVAEALPDDTYPPQAVFELRGTAWKERANALMVLGDYPAALDALTQAERTFAHSWSPAFGLSTVALIRGSVLYEQGQLDDAAASAERAEHGFAYIAQEERRIRAVFLRACIRYEAHDLVSAVALFQQVLEYGEGTSDSRWIARASYALGNCEVERTSFENASVLFHKALVIFRRIGPQSDRLATEWGLARIVLLSGRYDDAIRRLRDVASGYERRSMITNGALVWLDIVDALLTLGQTEQVVDIATRLFRIFREAGMITRAPTAIAYLKDEAAAGRLNSAGVNAVRTYLRRAERQARSAEHYLRKCYKAKTAVRASELAAELEMSAEHLSRLAIQIFGKPRREYLREKQLTYAEGLLRTLPQEITVEEIALHSGFGTHRTFHRCFVDAYGMTPGAFRELVWAPASAG